MYSSIIIIRSFTSSMMLSYFSNVYIISAITCISQNMTDLICSCMKSLFVCSLFSIPMVARPALGHRWSRHYGVI